MESSIVPQNARKLWHILRAVYYVLLKGISKHKLTLDFHLLFKRGKLAAKAVAGGLRAVHPAVLHDCSTPGVQIPNYLSALACRSMDPSTAVHLPRAVEFSCRSTPSYSSVYNFSRRRRRRHQDNNRRYNDRFDGATVTKLFELLDKDAASDDEVAESPLMVPWDDGNSTASDARQVRITDSPFPVVEEESKRDGVVDKQAEEFISWFHEQLRLQQHRATFEPRQYYCAR